MKISLLILLTSALLIQFGPSITCAEPVASYYSGSLGIVFTNDSDVNDGIESVEFSHDVGLGLSAAIGAVNERNERAEIELSYRQNDLDDASRTGFPPVNIKGEVIATSLMLNAYFSLGPNGDITPFFGLGAGGANIKVDIAGADSESDIVVAYQGFIGGSFSTDKDISFDLQYRFLGTSNPRFKGVEAEYSTHNIMFGIRQNF